MNASPDSQTKNACHDKEDADGEAQSFREESWQTEGPVREETSRDQEKQQPGDDHQSDRCEQPSPPLRPCRHGVDEVG